MSSIDYSQSKALLLAQAIENEYKLKVDSIFDFERTIETTRTNYDAENDDYDRRERYPDKQFLEERYKHWGTVIENLSKQQQQLVDLSGKLNKKLVDLEWSILDPAIIPKIISIHANAGREIEACNQDLQLKYSALSQNLRKIQDLADKALYEINWIINHPHVRLRQTLSRVTNGQYAASFTSKTGDRVSRNLSSFGSSVWGSQSTHNGQGYQ